jgi:hypothetical protein
MNYALAKQLDDAGFPYISRIGRPKMAISIRACRFAGYSDPKAEHVDVWRQRVGRRDFTMVGEMISRIGGLARSRCRSRMAGAMAWSPTSLLRC